MTTEERRRAILDTLTRANQPVSAAALARRFGVSRQIVVGDVALLSRRSSTPWWTRAARCWT